MRKFLKYIIAALFIGALQLWGENSEVAEGFFDSYIEPIFDKLSIPLVWFVIPLLALLEYYKGRISDLESDMNNEMELQIKANKQLSAYRRKDLFHNFIHSYVEREDAVQAVQLYKYTLKRKFGEIEVKVEYVDGYVHEGIGLNALVKIYYHLDKSIYKEFKAAKAILDNHRKVQPLVSFVRKYSSRFSGMTPESVTEHDATQFAVLQLAVDLIEGWFFEEFGDSVELNLIDLPQDALVRLNEAKRTGILRAILLMNSYYRFSHTGLGEKHGRLYLARQVFLWDVNHVFLVTLDPDILEEHTAGEQLDQIQARFLIGLQKWFDVMYTRNNENAGGDQHEQAE